MLVTNFTYIIKLGNRLKHTGPGDITGPGDLTKDELGSDCALAPMVVLIILVQNTNPSLNKNIAIAEQKGQIL